MGGGVGGGRGWFRRPVRRRDDRDGGDEPAVAVGPPRVPPRAAHHPRAPLRRRPAHAVGASVVGRPRHRRRPQRRAPRAGLLPGHRLRLGRPPRAPLRRRQLQHPGAHRRHRRRRRGPHRAPLRAPRAPPGHPVPRCRARRRQPLLHPGLHTAPLLRRPRPVPTLPGLLQPVAGQSNGVIPLDNALFKPLPPSLEMVDPNTLLHYTNVFDAMLDAVHVAVKNLNATGGGGPVPVLVTETGWPSYGDRRAEPYATRDNADAYNSNLIKHVNDKPGTPMRPGAQASVYIYELFNEDLRPGPVSEANWGLFHGNGTPVYLLHVSGAGGFLANDTTDRTFCIASDDADEKAVQAAMDWACGPGRTDCTAIQPGQGCYEPNDVRSHASFAFDSYYQSQGKAAGSCYFQGVGMVTTTDPSHDSCIFPGSKLLSNVTKSDGANTTTAQTSDAEGSAIWRLRTGRETGFLFILRWLLSLSVVLITTNSNFWT
ncbi:glucan endo-1,3-beta-glucosidase 1 isoform X2 [Oryza sativa Japonica Group]|uniref:glucan endo-1,3-beta-glucosidase 1 isoform X2 n=1 Tax=Oryza sativa subsp. japonica TaxID=39947 RepID=UPI00339BA46B